MPYIDQSSRDGFVEVGEAMENAEIHTPGELNYICTLAIREFMRDKKFCYATLNEAIGALECCKLELYRRLASPYEDECVKKNGDIDFYERYN